MTREPELIAGGCASDDRGRLTFANDFDLGPVRRMYIVENFATGTVRAWHGHKVERKWVMAIAGAALVCAVPIDDWDKPATDAPISRFTIDAQNPCVVAIPAGFANGAMSLLEGTKILYLSDATLGGTTEDDYRFPSRYWDPWQVEER